MKLFGDLSEEDRKRHLEIASGLLPNKVYLFYPPISAIPCQRLIKGSPDEGVPICFTRARFIRYRCWPSIFQDCLFLVQVDQTEFTERFRFTVPLLFTRGMKRPKRI